MNIISVFDAADTRHFSKMSANFKPNFDKKIPINIYIYFNVQ